MKIRKTLLSLALSGAMVFGLLPGMTMTALADTSTYTLTIPSTLSVANSGWNATDGISATGTLESGKKLIVSASSDDEFALVNQNDSTKKVGYKLATASTDTEATTSWEFTELTNTATTKLMGIIVDDYSSMPAGTYQDTVTFTAKVETAANTLTFKGNFRATIIDDEAFDFKEIQENYNITIEYDDNDTWGDLDKKYDWIYVEKWNRNGTIIEIIHFSYTTVNGTFNAELKHSNSSEDYELVKTTSKVTDFAADGYYLYNWDD